MAEEVKNAIRQKILDYLAENDIVKSSRIFCGEQGIDHEVFVGAMNSLISKEMILSSSTSVQGFALKDEGKEFLALGSYEYRIFSAVPEEGVAQKDLEVSRTS
jgi:phenylalanyl-tRNA synthetase alpha chain